MLVVSRQGILARQNGFVSLAARSQQLPVVLSFSAHVFPEIPVCCGYFPEQLPALSYRAYGSQAAAAAAGRLRRGLDYLPCIFSNDSAAGLHVRAWPGKTFASTEPGARLHRAAGVMPVAS